MNSGSLALLRLFLVIGSLTGAPSLSVLADTGNDNPTGVAGAFNPLSRTGGSYDPYTLNATRTISDLTVSGAVGTYPLQWNRTMNSRALAGSGATADLGQAGGWNHSYSWTVNDGNQIFSGSVPGQPTAYTVAFPDGRVERFTWAAGDSCFHSRAGVQDRFQPIDSSKLCYLILPDGGEVQFQATAHSYQDDPNGVEEWFSYYTYQALGVLDPDGLFTSFTFSAGQLTQVTEPAGRWLKISYRSDTGYAGFIDHVDAGYGVSTVTQSVYYTYTPFGAYNVLTKADYKDGSLATYQYQPSNSSGTATPLIYTCSDVRYAGPMKGIQYTFLANGAYGQLYEEDHLGDGTMVDRITVTGARKRTETRGDYRTRTFQYGSALQGFNMPQPYLIGNSSDFYGLATYYGYDGKAFLNAIQDAKGHVTTMTRIANTGVISVINYPWGPNTPAGSKQFFYTDQSTGYYLDHVIDELNHVTYYHHNDAGTMRTTSINYPDGGVEIFGYNDFNQVTSHTFVSNTNAPGSGGMETFFYDSRGLLKSYTPPITDSDKTPGNHPTAYSYDGLDHLWTITDPRGATYVTTLTHNARGQLTSITHPDADASQIVYDYNDDGTLQDMKVDYAKNTAAETDYSYDDYKRLRSVTTPGHPTPETTTYYYAIGGGAAEDYTHTDAQVRRQVLPSQNVILNAYDFNFRLTSTTTGYGTSDAAMTSYTYDAVGNLASKVEPDHNPAAGGDGKQWSYTYDARDRLYYVDDPTATDQNSDGHTITYNYDAAGNKTLERPANNQTVTYDSYDYGNRLTQMTVGQWPNPTAVTHYTWTKAGKLATMTDPDGNLYSYAYDPMNRLETTTYPPDGGNQMRTEGYTYDWAGNPHTFTNRMGYTQTFTFDARNRQTAYSWNDGVTLTVTQTYDDASRLLTCNTAKTSITNSYYVDGLLHTQEEWTGYFGDDGDGSANHRKLTYAYDADGNRSSLSSGLAGVVAQGYNYSHRDQLLNVTAGIGGSHYVDYIYDKSGNVTNRSLSNSTSSILHYDELDRIYSVTHTFATTSRTLNYGFDVMSNPTYVQRLGDANANHPRDDGFAYDYNNQLKDFYDNGTLSGGHVTTGTHFNYLCDAAGNWKTIKTNDTVTGTYTPNQLNLYATVNSVQLTSWGNGTLKTYKDSDGATWTYTYDAMNRLTEAKNDKTGSNAVDANFYYDGLNRQIARSITGEGTIFSVWDGWQLYAEMGTGGSLSNHWVYGGNDLVVSTADSHFYYPDGLGNTTYMAGALGYLLETYTYDAFGTVSALDLNDNSIDPSGSLLFKGQKWYPALGLYDLRNRAYLPSLGRFLQPDPIGFAGDGSNLYRYCGNNPVNRSDPMGLFTFQIGFSLTYQIGPVSFNYNGGIAFDGHGNIGFYNTGLVGAGPGAGFSGGISLLGSNGDQIADLNNTFYTASVGGFAGGGASAEGFNGRGSHNQIVVGGGGTFGIGLGGGGYVGPSFTKVSPIYSPNDSSSNGSDSSLGNGNHITTPEPGAIIVTATPLPDLALDEYRLPGAGQAIGTFNGATVYQPNGFVLSSIVGGSAGGFRYDLGPNGSLGGLGGYGFGGFSYVPGASYDVEFGGGGNTVCHPPPMQP